jgi:hypothetical protein
VRTRYSPERRSAARHTFRSGDRARYPTLWGVVDQGFVSLASFTTTVIVGKRAGVTALGEYSLAFTIVLLLMMVQDCLIASPYSALCH